MPAHRFAALGAARDGLYLCNTGARVYIYVHIYICLSVLLCMHERKFVCIYLRVYLKIR